MHPRKASCRGAHYGTDRSPAAHGPHEFFPHQWAPATPCRGWSEEEASASAVVEEIWQYAHEHPQPDAARMEGHPAVIVNLTRLLEPDVGDISGLATADKLPGIITRLFGIPIVAAPLGPGEWRLVSGGGTDG